MSDMLRPPAKAAVVLAKHGPLTVSELRRRLSEEFGGSPSWSTVRDAVRSLEELGWLVRRGRLLELTLEGYRRASRLSEALRR